MGRKNGENMITKKIKKLIEKEEKLYFLAISRYLDKTDWDISEWLSEKEFEEYQKTRQKLELE